MTRRQRHELSTVAEVGCATADEQRARACLDHRCEGGMEFALASGFHEQDLPPDGATCCFHLSQHNCEFRLVRILQHGDDSGFRN